MSRVGRDEIEMMLPHRRPMLMVGRVLAHDERSLAASANIDPDNPLLLDGRLPGHAGLELIAQASGLLLGLIYEGEGSDGVVRPGAIVAVRGMQVNVPWLEANAPITIETEMMGGDEAAAMFDGRVTCADEVAMEATITVSTFPEGGAG